MVLCLVLLLAVCYYMYVHRNSPSSWPARLMSTLTGGTEAHDDEVGNVDEHGNGGTRREASQPRPAEAAALIEHLQGVFLHAQEQRDQRDARAHDAMVGTLQRLQQETLRSSSALTSASSTLTSASTAAVDAAAAAISAVKEQAEAEHARAEHARAEHARAEHAKVEATRALLGASPPDGISSKPGVRKAVPAGFKLFEQPYVVRVTAEDYDVDTGILSVAVNRRNCHMLELMQATMPRLVHTVNSLCNTFTVYAKLDTDDTEDKTTYGEYVVTLQDGDYTAASLEAHLQAQINAATETTTAVAFNDVVRSMTVVYNADTQKYTFALVTVASPLTTQRFYLKFTQPDLAHMLGFGFRDIFPHHTTLTDDTAATHVVVDNEHAASEAVAVPAVTMSYPAVKVSDVRTVIHKVAINAVTAVSSTGRADLTGGRYVVITCDALRQRYANDATVAWIDQSADVNNFTQGTTTYRRFPQPTPLDVLEMKLWIRLPTGKVAAADTSLLTFHLRFLTVFDNVTLRYDRHIPDKYDT